jgi:hypothetical protein
MGPEPLGQAVNRQFSYTVIEADTTAELMEKVAMAARAGFLPSGGMTVARGDSGLVGSRKFFQPMVFLKDVPAGPAPTEGAGLLA